LPRRYRPPTRRKKRRSRPKIPSISIPLPAVEEVGTEEGSEAAETPVAPPVTVVPLTSRHVARDYSYVLAELRRIALVIAVIVVGLIVTAAALRWF